MVFIVHFVVARFLINDFNIIGIIDDDGDSEPEMVNENIEEQDEMDDLNDDPELNVRNDIIEPLYTLRDAQLSINR